MAVILGLGLLFYIVSGFRLVSWSPGVQAGDLDSETPPSWGFLSMTGPFWGEIFKR